MEHRNKTVCFHLFLVWACESCSIAVKGATPFEYMAMGVSGPQREGSVRRRGKLHDKESNHLYTSSNIIRMIKSRMTKSETRVARIRGNKCVQDFDRETCRKETTCKTKALVGM